MSTRSWTQFSTRDWYFFSLDDWYSFSYETSRCNSRRLPDSFIADLTEPLNNPSGQWSDFNEMHLYWEELRYNYVGYAGNGLMCTDDLPPEPLPSEYPNME